MEKYNHKEIEAKWRKKWADEKLYLTKEETGKPKYYILDMFPYPSGAGLHVGHPKGFIATDIFARLRILQGYNVLHPMGWDAFGLPAENYALANKVHPRVATEKNIATFKAQLEKLGFTYDWGREINTTDPEFYKWTQWTFLKMFEKGLAYESNEPVNWCPSCKTVLSNEDLEGGKCERCGSVVERKPMRQWVLKITDYADRLLYDLEKLPDWEESIKEMQKNWIGRSEGATVRFTVILKSRQSGAEESRAKQTDSGSFAAAQDDKRGTDSGSFAAAQDDKRGTDSGSFANTQDDNLYNLEVFTTRPDTLFGCTYMVVAPEHPLIKNYELQITNYDEVEKYIEDAKKKSDLERTELQKDKTGVELKGLKAINPVNNEEIPIFVADYVLISYGTGAIMAVPAHDQRDYDFAKKYDLSVKQVVAENDVLIQNSKFPDRGTSKIQNDNSKFKSNIKDKAFEDEGVSLNSDFLNGLETKNAKEKMINWLEEHGDGIRAVNYKLKDWVFSRQRYWGEPIPIVHCAKCAQEKELVLILHGWEDSSQTGFIPALKKDLELKGYEVLALDLPDTNKPVFEAWHDYTEKEIKDKKIKNFHIIGHSMGAHLGLKLAEKYKLKSLSLAAPVGFEPSEEYFNQFTDELTADEMKIFKKFQSRSLDIDKVKNNVKNINFIFGGKDPWITEEIRNYFMDKFDKSARFTVLKDYAHMSESEGVKELEPLEKLFKRSNPGVVPVPEKDLPVLLPDVENYEPTGTGESPLANIKEWVNTVCPECGGPAKRETNTMPQWAGSSWYYLRFIDPDNSEALVSKEKDKYWSPVDFYVGGAEHATRHLIYARFWHKFLYDIGAVNYDEPFTRLQHVGLILAEDGRKMSKRWNNVINPDEIVAEFGADAMRVYEMFMGPFSQPCAWSTNGLVGARKFLEKVWNLKGRGSKDEGRGTDTLIERLLHKTIKKVGEDIENFKFNTAIAQMMIFINALGDEKKINKKVFEKFVIILSPFAPFLAEEIWFELSNSESVFKQKWPAYDPALAKDETIELVIQVNGKLRDTINVHADIGEAEAKQLALEREKIKKWIDGKEIVKVIFVAGKLANIVIR